MMPAVTNLRSLVSTSRGNGDDVWEGSMSGSDTARVATKDGELWGDGMKVKSELDLESDNGVGVLPYRRNSLRKFPVNLQTKLEPRQGKLSTQQLSGG